MPVTEYKRGLVGIVLGLSLALDTQARAPARPELFDAFLAVDARIVDSSHVENARAAFEALIRHASSCGTDAIPRQERARCVVDALFSSGELQTIEDPG